MSNLDINPRPHVQGRYIMNIGVDLGGSHVGIGVVENGEIIEYFEHEIKSKERENIREFIEQFIIEKCNICKEKFNIEKIGIAVPGTVDDKEIIKAVNLELFNYKLVENLNKYLDIPMHLINDGKAACLAEHKYGALKGYENAIFLTLGTGIGGAVIYENELLKAKGIPGYEIGHMIIEKNGKPCRCGKNGCFEQYASMKYLKNRYREEMNVTEEKLGREIMQAIIKTVDEPKVKEIIEEFVDNLSIGISNLVNIFEPECICIGGSFAYYKDTFLPLLKEKLLKEGMLFNKREDIIIVGAKFGNDAGIIGASLV